MRCPAVTHYFTDIGWMCVKNYLYDVAWWCPADELKESNCGVLAETFTDSRPMVSMLRIGPYTLQGLTLNYVNYKPHSECCGVFKSTVNAVVIGKTQLDLKV